MRKRGARGQVSVEYLLVLGIALVILLPGAYLFYSFSKGSSDQMASARITRAGTEIVNTVEAMYAIGQNSWSTVTVNVPETVSNIYVVNNEELVLEYETQNGATEAVFFSDVNITTPYNGNLSSSFAPGLTKIKVSSKGVHVEIQELII